MIFKIRFSVVVTLKKLFTNILVCAKSVKIFTLMTIYNLYLYNLTTMSFSFEEKKNVWFSVELHRTFEFRLYSKLTLITLSI